MEEFARFPLALNDIGLTAREYRQLILEINYCNSKPFHWHSAEDMAETLGTSIKLIRRTWSSLVSKGAITRLDNKTLNRWETHLVIALPYTGGLPLKRGRGLPSTGGGGSHQKGAIIEEPYKEPYKEPIKNPLHPPRGKSGFKPSLDFINEEEWKEVYQLWVNNKKGKFTKQIGVEKGYLHLLKLSNNDLSTAREIIDNSLANNWQGLFSAKSSPGKAEKPIYRHGGSINFDL